jgi:predicted flap endonuclease-1-like 5' DNA nuclease
MAAAPVVAGAEPAVPETTASPEPVAPAVPAGDGDDDFTRIYGIDAATAALLQGAGIHSYRELAAADVRNLREMMAGAGQSAVDPTTWSQQARFAAGAKWKQLEKMQLRFKGEHAA